MFYVGKTVDFLLLEEKYEKRSKIRVILLELRALKAGSVICSFVLHWQVTTISGIDREQEAIGVGCPPVYICVAFIG